VRTVRTWGGVRIERGVASNQLTDPGAVTARRATLPVAPKKRFAAPPDIQVGGNGGSVFQTDRAQPQSHAPVPFPHAPPTKSNPELLPIHNPRVGVRSHFVSHRIGQMRRHFSGLPRRRCNKIVCLQLQQEAIHALIVNCKEFMIWTASLGLSRKAQVIPIEGVTPPPTLCGWSA